MVLKWNDVVQTGQYGYVRAEFQPSFTTAPHVGDDGSWELV